MKFFKKAILSILVFIIVALLGAVYFFLTAKNRELEIKIGENIFKAEVAETASRQAKGLSFRNSLDKNSGMFFDFKKQGTPGFWMMGMKFPIDIIWISNNEIVGIERNVLAPTTGTPESALKIYYPPQLIDMVLEINGGLSDKLGIKAGDKFVIIK